MRGKVARALRKEIGFDPNSSREYVEHELIRVRNILQYNHEAKKAEIVERPVSVFITECTDGDRNFYQYLKKKWNNPEHEAIFNQLPEVDELAKLARNIMSDKEVEDDLKKTNKTLDQLTESNDSKED
jgi:hypothetical protein